MARHGEATRPIRNTSISFCRFSFVFFCLSTVTMSTFLACFTRVSLVESLWLLPAHSIIELSSGGRDRTCCDHFIWFHFIFYLFLRTILKLPMLLSSLSPDGRMVYGEHTVATIVQDNNERILFRMNEKLTNDEDATRGLVRNTAATNVNEIIHK